MSKLKEILYDYEDNATPADNPYIDKWVEGLEKQIKVLILETFGDALIESKSVEEMGEKFRAKVLSL